MVRGFGSTLQAEGEVFGNSAAVLLLPEKGRGTAVEERILRTGPEEQIQQAGCL